MAYELTEDLAGRFAAIALSHVQQEYPNKLDHVLEGPGDLQGPRDLHPIFFGSYDWHSCVHGYWLLARTTRRHGGHAEAGRVAALFEARLTAEAAAGELAYLQRPSSRGFERPYGWAWTLALVRELRSLEDGRHAKTLEPLAAAFVERFLAYLPRADYPVRTGVHGSSAFALTLALAYARDAGCGALERAICEKALAWFGEDADARPFEPSGEDFLSPTLMEAELMRAVLPPADFGRWVSDFLPELQEGRPATLFEPARVSDRTDGRIAHLDGLNLSRAWCFGGLIQALDAESHPLLSQARSRHLEASLAHVSGDYMGEHWLASFATLAIDGL